jgi:hypothetical protein
MEPLRLRRRPEGVEGAARTILENLDVYADRATSQVLGGIPSYQSEADELARSVRYTMRAFLDFATSGVPPSENELTRLGDVGRRRAESRIPLADVLHAFRVSARTVLAALSESHADMPSAAVLWLAEALMAYIDVVSTLVTNRYVETQADLLRAEEVRRREFLSDLLHGHRSGAEALAEAATLGVELLGESRVLVVGTPSTADDLSAEAEKRVEELIAPTPVLNVRIGGDLVILPLGPVDPSEVAGAVGDVLVGEGRIHSGLEGIRASYAEAREALSIARATGAGPVARFHDLVLDRLLRQDPALLAEFVGQTVGPLQAYDARRHTDLLQTLEVWAQENGSPTAAAERLHVHPHTVSYRLGRIEELTALSLSAPDERQKLLLGLRALRLLGHSFVSMAKMVRDDSGARPGDQRRRAR